MSTPQNPLSIFRTYSYHHVLILADSIATATAITSNDTEGENALNNYLRTEETSQYSSGSLEIISVGNGKGKYIIMSNGLGDARYTIEELKWETITSQKGNGSTGNYTSMFVEGAMVINEPKGVRFLNDIKKSFSRLKSNPNACIWMIKTFFIGHTHSGETEIISNVEPLLFHIVDLQADFTVLGSVYDIKFVTANNGIAKMPYINNITETMKINLSTTDNTTLKGALNFLFSNIEERYTKYYNSVKDEMVTQGYNPLKIQYVLELDDIYKDSIYRVDDVQQQNTKGGERNSGAILDFSKHITIENAIKTIMNKCSQIKQDAKGITNDNKKYTFKIRSIIDSGESHYIIRYHISRQEMIYNNNNIFDSKVNDPKLKENTLELDYIYSGKNIDIIDFSMKMELGLILYQKIINSNNLGSQSESITINETTVEKQGEGVSLNNKEIDGNGTTDNIKTPVFFSKTIKNPEVRNTKNPKDAVEYKTLLDRHAALENIESKVKIHGNPSLLNSVCKTPATFLNTKAGKDETFPHWETAPALAKINIFMPTNTHNIIKEFDNFWYTGLYFVLSVANEFSGGLFTQELTMISIPNSLNTDKPDAKETYGGQVNDGTYKKKSADGKRIEVFDSTTGQRIRTIKFP